MLDVFKRWYYDNLKFKLNSTFNANETDWGNCNEFIPKFDYSTKVKPFLKSDF
jgi:hypothetical protein